MVRKMRAVFSKNPNQLLIEFLWRFLNLCRFVMNSNSLADQPHDAARGSQNEETAGLPGRLIQRALLYQIEKSFHLLLRNREI